MDALNQIVEKIVAGTKLTRDEVLAKIREEREELHEFVSLEGAASIVAHRLGVMLDFQETSGNQVSRSTKNHDGGIRMGFEFEVEEPKRIDEGKHEGVITKMELRESGKGTRTFEYLDIYIRPDGSNFELKVGYSPFVSNSSRLGKLLARFGADVSVGKKVNAETVLLNRRCSFVTVDDETKGGTFARIQHDSVKPVA
jgi:hypothetical protein